MWRSRFGWIVVFSLLVGGAWSLGAADARAAETARGDLTVKVTKLESSKGKIRAGIFESNKGFPLKVDEVDTTVEAEITDNSATVTFDDLEHGTYAVVVYHDANGNGSLDRNFFGMPKEGAGVFKPVKSRFPPPTFDDCKFEFDDTEQTVSLTLRYL